MLSKNKIIFLSGRFRSGTSMMWNLFNQLPEYCAWYEPLHPNLISHIKFVKPKEDHIGIDDYWRNYCHLKNLKQHHCADFGQRKIFLEQFVLWKELQKYIQYLIDNSGDKIPVLQFNRMDLRLGWLRNNFPNATIIHLKREVYPLWVSCRKHLKTQECRNYESHPDAYDLMQWSADLSLKFPMLQAEQNRHGYYRHYFIWKLAQQIAKNSADIHLSLEQDFLNSNQGVKKLSELFNWDDTTIDTVKNYIKQPESSSTELEKSKLFTSIEKLVDQQFEELGLNNYLPSSPLTTIKLEHQKGWLNYPRYPEITIAELLNAIKFQKDELTAAVN